MVNIFSIDTWESGRTWKLHDTVQYNGLIYFALNDITNSTTAPSSDTTNWGGYKIYKDGINRPQFLWSTSYGFSRDATPSVRKINFGDGYTQRSRDGISNNLLNLNLVFNNRTLRETSAILTFLEKRGGTESFIYIPPSPFSKEALFICEKWVTNNVFYDNYTIDAAFQEVTI